MVSDFEPELTLALEESVVLVEPEAELPLVIVVESLVMVVEPL